MIIKHRYHYCLAIRDINKSLIAIIEDVNDNDNKESYNYNTNQRIIILYYNKDAFWKKFLKKKQSSIIILIGSISVDNIQC